MIAPWLQRLLDAKGTSNSDGVSRAARAGHCRSCGQVVIRGLDADRAALPATCDPGSINALGEFLAVTTGRRTYDLDWRGRYELSPREPAHISDSPPGSKPNSPVVVAHECDSPMPAAGRVVAAPAARTTREENERCPF